MTSIKKEWEDYLKSVYPGKISPIQHRETMQAFFAGALSVLGILSKLSELPEDNAAVELGLVHTEVKAVCRGFFRKTSGRN